MVCKSCGAEIVSKRRSCPKCGMPIIDYVVRPKEEEEDDLKRISKRILVLKPIVKAEEEEKERKKEEERKKREEELKRLEEEERKRYEEEEDEEEEEEYLSGYEEDDEDEDSDDIEEDEEEEEEEDLTPHRYRKSAETEETLTTESDDKSKYTFVEAGTMSVTKAVEEVYVFSNSIIKVTGLVCFIDVTDDYAVFNIEDEDESLSCFVKLKGLESVTYEELIYTKEDIINIVSSLERGQRLIVEGILLIGDDGNPELKLLSIEGDDFYIRCHE